MLEINCIEPRVVRIGLSTALNILKKWNCNQLQVQGLLKLPVNYDSLNFDEMRFSREQQERVSYILNIHAGLGTVFKILSQPLLINNIPSLKTDINDCRLQNP